MFRLKPPVDIMVPLDGGAPGDGHGVGLKRTLSIWQLAAIGIACTVGTGIFVTFSQVVPAAGPGVLISFVIAGVTAGLTALCYAEVSSKIPLAGSSYSYTYASLGEIAAYLVGWCLLLEYSVSTAAVASGWSGYLNQLLSDLGLVNLPDWMSHAPAAGQGFGVNLPAVVLVGLCALLLIKGTSESARTNAIMTAIKLTVLLFFAAIAFLGFHASNLHPFAPHGVAGIGTAAGMVFFSYIGMDAVSTAAEEVENPRKALPKALILALAIVTGIYLLVALAAIGARRASQFDPNENAPLAVILHEVTGWTWTSALLSAAAVISIFSVTLVTLYGQTRVLHSMSSDGLVPKIFSNVNPRTRTPIGGTVIVAVFVAVLTGLVPLDILADFVSLGTLVAFAVVSGTVIILRRRRQGDQDSFQVPFYPALPVASIGACFYLMYTLADSDHGWLTYSMFGIWMTIAVVVYFTYARHHAVLAEREPASETLTS
ncbi:MAG: APC family permease [Segniliparus sp.]|uniref:APC family permease n=1 Tax=Segniliparus sp. TaxID=2804064 RepID=UPI003F31BE31